MTSEVQEWYRDNKEELSKSWNILHRKADIEV